MLVLNKQIVSLVHASLKKKPEKTSNLQWMLLSSLEMGTTTVSKSLVGNFFLLESKVLLKVIQSLVN